MYYRGLYFSLKKRWATLNNLHGLACAFVIRSIVGQTAFLAQWHTEAHFLPVKKIGEASYSGPTRPTGCITEMEEETRSHQD